MKILVTGGAGYIGSLLAPKLLADNHQVTVMDCLMYEQTPLLDQFQNQNFKFVFGDVRDQKLLKEQIDQHDAIIPLACLTGAPICDKNPMQAKEVNHDAIKFIADTKSDSQILIFPSTNSGYGVGNADVECDENSPLYPVSLYGKLKVDIEKYLLENINCVCFRFATLFGMSPRMRIDLLVNDFVFRAKHENKITLFEAHFKRNFLHVRDAVKAFEHTISNYEAMQGKTFNIGLSNANISKEDLCKLIQKQIPSFEYSTNAKGKDPDQRNYIVSNKRVESTGFSCDYSLEQGITELIKGYELIRDHKYANI